jgi:hypothetical protein
VRQTSTKQTWKDKSFSSSISGSKTLSWVRIPVGQLAATWLDTKLLDIYRTKNSWPYWKKKNKRWTIFRVISSLSISLTCILILSTSTQRVPASYIRFCDCRAMKRPVCNSRFTFTQFGWICHRSLILQCQGISSEKCNKKHKDRWSVSQSVSLGRSVSVSQWICQSVSVGQTVSVSQPVSQSQSVSQSRSVGRSVSQSRYVSLSQSLSLSVSVSHSQSVCQS